MFFAFTVAKLVPQLMGASIWRGEKMSGILFARELDALCVCVARGRPFGSMEWLTRTGKRLGNRSQRFSLARVCPQA